MVQDPTVRILLCLLAVTGCYDHNGSHCPGSQRICAWHFDGPDACGEYRRTELQTGGTASVGWPAGAFTDQDGHCVLWLNDRGHPDWGPPEPWCNMTLMDDPGPCESEGEWLRSETDE